MILLIPLALIAGVVVMTLVMAQTDHAESQASLTTSLSRSVSFHHQTALSRPVLATGYVQVPGGEIFTAFEGLDTYAHIEGGTTFVMTWARRFRDDGQAGINASHHENHEVRSVFQRSLQTLSEVDWLPGTTIQGDLEEELGAFNLRIGSVLIPFDPPLELGAPVILTILSES